MILRRRFLYVAALAVISCVSLVSCGSKEKEAQVNEGEETAFKIEKSELDLKDGLPTVIDFYATWCNPCKQIEPVFEELEQKYSDKINFMRVDVDKQPEIAQEYNVQAMPTFVFLGADDNEIERITGSYPDRLRALVSKIAELNTDQQ